MTTPTVRIELPMDDLRAFCERWGIVRFALFGSVLRDDFGPESDVDVLAWFDDEQEPHSLMSHVRMELELGELLGRKVEVVHRSALDQDHNKARSRSIIEAARVVYRAG